MARRSRGTAWDDVPSSESHQKASPPESMSNALTLCLVMFGGALFPIPFAFANTGVVLGITSVAIVAALNCYTCVLLLRCVQGVSALGIRPKSHRGGGGTLSFEGLAGAVGGRAWENVARVSLVVLLFGTACAGLAVIGEAGGRTLCNVGLVTGSGGGDTGSAGSDGSACAPFPGYLKPLGMSPIRTTESGGGGLLSLLVIALCILAPLCVKRDITGLAKAGALGLGLLVLFVVALVKKCADQHMPAVRVMGTSAWLLRVNTRRLEWTVAFPILGYALYVHPVLLPMLGEMVAGLEKTRNMRVGVQSAGGQSSGISSAGTDEQLEPASLTETLLGSPARHGRERDAVENADGFERDASDDASGLRHNIHTSDNDAYNSDDYASHQSHHASVTAAVASLEKSIRLAMAFACFAYVVVGVCGYGLFGTDVATNVLLDMNSPWLDLAMTAYQALCFPPTFHSLRGTLYDLLDAEKESPASGVSVSFDDRDDTPREGYARREREGYAIDPVTQGLRSNSDTHTPSSVTEEKYVPHFWRVHVPRVAFLLLSAIFVASALPRSETLFALTGAVGVSVVCYGFPIAITWRLSAMKTSGKYGAAMGTSSNHRLAGHGSSGLDGVDDGFSGAFRDEADESDELDEGYPARAAFVRDPRSRHKITTVVSYVKHTVVPCLVLAFGVALSVLGLYATLKRDEG